MFTFFDFLVVFGGLRALWFLLFLCLLVFLVFLRVPLFLPNFSHFPFSHSLSLSLFLSRVIFFMSSFLVFFHCFFIVLIGLFLCICFMKRTTSKITFEGMFSSILSVFVFLFCFVFEIPFFSSFYSFPCLKTLGPTSPTPSFFGVLVFLFFVWALLLLFLFCCWSVVGVFF